MKPLSKNIIIFIVSILILGAIFSTYTLKQNKPEEISLSALVERIQNKQVKTIEIQGSEVHIVSTDDKKAITRKESGEPLSELLTNYGVTTDELRESNIVIKDKSGRAYVFGVILPSLLPLALLVLIFWFMFRQMQGASNKALSFGLSNVREIKEAKKTLSLSKMLPEQKKQKKNC